MSIIELYFGTHGRIGRKTFQLASVVPFTLQLGAWAGYGHAPIPPYLLAYVAGVAAFAMVMLNTKRLHDLGKSGWWQAFALIGIPLVAGAYYALVEGNIIIAAALVLAATVASLAGTWLTIQMWCFQGTEGDNVFGAQPVLPNTAQKLEQEITALQPTTARIALMNAPPPSGVIERKSRIAPDEPSQNGNFGRRDARLA